MVARDQLRSFIERIERLEAEKQTIADDIKDVYGEAKSTGFDAKILRKVISIRKQDADERAEQEAILDTYLVALGMQPDLFAEPDEPEQEGGAHLVEKVAAGMRTTAGRAALLTAVDIMIEREERQESDGGAIAAVKGNARLANADGVEPSPSEQFDPETGEITEIATNEGGANQDSVDMAQGSVPDLEPSGPEAERAQNSPETAHESPRKAAEAVSERTATQVDADASAEATIEGQPSVIVATSAESATAVERNAEATVEQRSTATILTAKPPSPLRPHCQRPENCGGYGRTHCGVCLRAKEREMA
ncbi:hypothetical protein BKP54_25185 [Ensifer sp. 1H6]|nr:hypothetical protein BKP54_25185 [Ensifer sp. 1H6]